MLGIRAFFNSYYEKSLKRDPENVTSLNGLGYVLACQDKDLTKATRTNLDNSPVDNLSRATDILTEVERRLGPLKRQSEDAKKYLSKAIALDKDNSVIEEHIKLVSMAGMKK